MRLLAAVALSLVFPSTAFAQDTLADARRQYNAGQYEAAERSARAALSQARTANSARVVLGRVLLERYRESRAAERLTEARDALRAVDPATLDPRERVELMLGFGEGLFFEDRFAAAADIFEPIIGAGALPGTAAQERALEWWATALDRHAAGRPFAERPQVYERIRERMTAELGRDPGSAPANYWLVAAAQGSGDVDAAWIVAQGAWLRAAFAGARLPTLRADIDRLVIEGIIPARAARVGGREPNLVIAGMVGEWEAFKAAWTR